MTATPETLISIFNAIIGSCNATMALVMAVIAIVALNKESKASRAALGTQTLLFLFEKANSPSMIHVRRKAAAALLAADIKSDELGALFDFLSIIAHLTHTSAIDVNLVYTQFSWWIVRYWEAVKPFLAEVRKSDPQVWMTLSIVADRLKVMEIKAGYPQDNYSPTAIKEFLKYEAEELQIPPGV